MPNAEDDEGSGLGSSYRMIEGLIYSYARFVDAGDFRGVGALFAEATFVASGEQVVGGEAVTRWLEGLVIRYDDGTPRTKHLITNLTIEIDDAAGTATSSSYVTVMQAAPDASLQTILVGRYFDEFLRRDSLWMFKRRKLKVDLVGDVSQHVRSA